MIINPNIGHFPIGQGYIYDGSLYPSHTGMTSLEVYCEALGITHPDGTVPSNGVVYELNNNIVPYNLNDSQNPRDIDMSGFKIINLGQGTEATDAATVGYVQDLHENGVNLSEIADPNNLLAISQDGNSLTGIKKSKVTSELNKLMAYLTL